MYEAEQDVDRMERELDMRIEVERELKDKVKDLKDKLAAAGREEAALKSQLARRDQRVRELEEELRGHLRPVMTSTPLPDAGPSTALLPTAATTAPSPLTAPSPITAPSTVT